MLSLIAVAVLGLPKSNHKLDPKMEPRRSQAGAKTEPSWIQDGPRRSQAGAKMEPIWAKMEPRWAKMEPRWAKIEPR